MDPRQALDFERPIIELENKIAELKQLGGPKLSIEIRRLEWRTQHLMREIFANLSPWQKVQLSRHPLRPFSGDYIARLCEDFFELHGDRAFRDDAAIVGGLARMQVGDRKRTVMIIGHQKGRGTKESLRRNFGMPRPEGYRKGRRLMELAARLGIPVLSFIDTPGAYPGIDAEERGQAEAIAKNLEVMAGLPVPTVAVVIGEGGSGGALALGVCDRILMMEYAVYSVISPEGCASILWKDQSQVEAAAAQMRMTAEDLKELAIIDEVIVEPPGGAHKDVDLSAQRIGQAVSRHLQDLIDMAVEARLEARYRKYRSMGIYSEG